jgi:hypothetical protein
MRKGGWTETPQRVLARVLAVNELPKASGSGPDTTWTDGPERKDLTQISAGDTPGSPPPPDV